MYCSYFQLPPRCQSWFVFSEVLGPALCTVAESFTIQTPLCYKRTACPARGKTVESWTEQERKFASEAVEATSLEHLTQLVRF
jgi:hypothetical protein